MRIELDAGGDEREVPLDSVRYLPSAYPLVKAGSDEDKVPSARVIQDPALSKQTKQVRGLLS